MASSRREEAGIANYSVRKYGVAACGELGPSSLNTHGTVGAALRLEFRIWGLGLGLGSGLELRAGGFWIAEADRLASNK